MRREPSPTATIECVLFDAGGVLVHPDWQKVLAVIEAEGGSAMVDALIAGEHAQWASMDTAEIRVGQDNLRASLFLDGAMARAGVPGAVRARVMPVLEDIRGRGHLWDYVPAHVPGALAALKARGLRLGVVSNANGRMPEKLARLGLAVYFDTIVDSGIEGVEKPDPRVFAIALERMGARADRALFVGDLYHVDVVGARAAGLRPVLVDKGDHRRDADVARIRRISDLEALL